MMPTTAGDDPRNGETSKLRQQFEGSNQNTAHTFSPQGTDQVKPTFPDINFLPGRVLGKLLTGRRLTHKDSWLEMGHARLADSIWKLRKLGWPVRIIEEVAPTSDAGRKASIGIYFLDEETIAETGERGQRYAAECARVEQERRAA